MIKNGLNRIQNAAYELIQSDANFLYTLINIQNNFPNIKTNYIMMCQPYIGIFADGAEQWCKKVGLNAPVFTKIEKIYYEKLRQSHKLFEKSYNEYRENLIAKFKENDSYFYKRRNIFSKYDNVGIDLYESEFCGNTILCAMYLPIDVLNISDAGIWIKEITIITGKLVCFFNFNNSLIYGYDCMKKLDIKDYHFYKQCPIRLKNDLGFVLFSILCSINYIIEFIDKFFVEEIPQKFKFAYIQYYYLCDFIKDLNKCNNTNFFLNDTLKNREFRNCLTHYGLGQVMHENDIVDDDLLKGLTNKVFNMNYYDTKKNLYNYLNDLVTQIKKVIFD